MSTLVVDRNIGEVPRPIVDKLRAVIRRARMVMLVRGSLAVLSVALLALLAGMAIDTTFTIFSVAVRATLSGTLLAAVLAAAYVFLARPLAKSYSLTGIARMIETRHPELQERFSSAVQLLTSRDSTELRGSEALIAELAKEAVGQVDFVSPEQEFQLRAARGYLIMALTGALLLAASLVLWPSAARRAVNRVLAPLANIGNVRSADIEVNPGDVVVAMGDALRIEVLVPNARVSSANIRRLGAADDVETAERMKPLSADDRGYPRFFLSVPAVTESFRYRIHCGGAVSRYYDVKVVPRPAIEEFEARYEFPEYMNRTAEKTLGATGNIQGPVGCSVVLTARANTLVASAQAVIAGMAAMPAKIETGADGASRCTWKFELTEELVGGRTWTLSVEDQHGFMNWPAEHLIKAVPDKSPGIAIVDPATERLRLKPTDALPLHFRGEDDFGVAKVELLASVDGRDAPPVELALPAESDRRTVNGMTLVELAKLTSEGSRVVTLQLRASDNLPQQLKGPHTTLSNIVTVTLDETSRTFFELQAGEDYSSIRDSLLKVLADLRTAQQQTDGLDKLVAAEGRLDEPILQRIDQVRDLAGEAQQTLRELSDILPLTSFAALASETSDLADTDVQGARDRAGQIKLSDLPQKRSEHAVASDSHLKTAIQRTEKLVADLEKLWKQIQDIADLKDLASQQQQLADAIANVDLANLPPMPLAEQQLELATKIAETIKAAPQALEDVLETKQQQAEDLVEAAQSLAAQQAELAELTESTAQPDADPEALKNKIAEAIAKRQEKIAQDAARLDREIEEAGKTSDEMDSNLGAKPADVADDIQKGELKQAATKAEDAVKQFDNAADALARNQPVPKTRPSTKPQDGKPQDGKPQDGKPQDGKPQDGEPQDGKPQDGKPQDGEPQDGKPQDGKPQDGKPQDGKPQDGKPQDGKPQDGEPQDGKPQDGKPQDGKPQDGKPQDGKPQDGKPQDGKPQDGEPQDGKPQGGKPALSPLEQALQSADLAKKAVGLAERQEAVAEQLKALDEGQLGKAIELMQRRVGQETGDLAEKANAVAQVLELLAQPAKAQASATQAVKELDNAKAQAGEALQQLAQLTPAPAKPGDAPVPGEPATPAKPGDAPAPGEPATPAKPTKPGDATAPAPGEPAAPAKPTKPGDATAPAPGEPAAPAKPGDAAPAPGEPATPAAPAKPGDAAAPAAPPASLPSPEKAQAAAVAQQAAASSLQNAATALQNLANEVATSPQAPTGEPLAGLSATEAASAPLGQSVEQAATAAAALQTPSPTAASQAAAASASQQAAAALANAVAAAAGEAGVPQQSSASPNRPGPPSPSGQPGPSQGGPSSQPAAQASSGTGEQGRIGGTVDSELELKLKDYGISVSQWTRLSGSLKSQIRQAEADGAPEEYRALVRRYFRELARRGAGQSGPRP